LKSQSFFGFDGILTADAQRKNRASEALRKWIDREKAETLQELQTLPLDPSPEDLARYRALNERLRWLAQMKQDHFPPVKDPNPELEGLLY